MNQIRMAELPGPQGKRCFHSGRSLVLPVAFVLVLAATLVWNHYSGEGALHLQRSTIMVFAAASLTDAVEEVATAFEKEHPDIQVLTNFAGSGELRRQIESGAPADIYLSANMKQVDILKEKKLISDADILPFVGNGLLLVVSSDARGPFPGLEWLKGTAGKIAIGSPGVVPAGTYAKEVLENSGLYKDLEPRLVLCQTVRQVVHYVATGEAVAGFTFTTDSEVFGDKVKTALKVPPGLHGPIRYGTVAMPGRSSVQRATFMAFLYGPIGRKALERRGFDVRPMEGVKAPGDAPR